MRSQNSKRLPIDLSKASTWTAMTMTFIAVFGIGLPMIFDVKISAEKFSLGLIIGIVLLITGDRFIDVVRDGERSAGIAEITRAIEQVIDCRYIGKYPEAWKYLITRLEYISCVKDVTVVYGIKQDLLDQFFYRQQSGFDPTGQIAEFVKKGGVWREIGSPNIKEAFIDKIVKEIGDDYNSRLFYAASREETPQMNFTVVEYKTRGEDNLQQRQVLFGWGHHKFDDLGHVFSSTNPFLVDTFDRLFTALSENVSPYPQASDSGQPSSGILSFPSGGTSSA